LGLGVELGKQFMIDQTRGIVRGPAPQPGKGGMIGGALIKGKTKKLLKDIMLLIWVFNSVLE